MVDIAYRALERKRKEAEEERRRWALEDEAERLANGIREFFES